MAGELENNDITSNDEMTQEEYIATLESEIDIKLAKVRSLELVGIFLIAMSGICFIFYLVAAYGSN